LNYRNNIRYFRPTCKSDALRAVHKSEVADGGPSVHGIFRKVRGPS